MDAGKDAARESRAISRLLNVTATLLYAAALLYGAVQPSGRFDGQGKPLAAGAGPVALRVSTALR